jgi:transglutaminase-like putative cysteine protease
VHFAIRYLTEYRYDRPVTDNLNALRVKPAVTATQRVDDFGVRVTPESRLQQHLDYYGTTVIERDAYRALASEYLLPFAVEPDDLRIDGLVGEIRDATARETLERIIEVIPDRFEYRAGVTYVGSTIYDLLDAGAGVCQDFAHLALLLLRRNGIAARYVSGYLFAPPPGQDDADSAEVDTHAWLEALLPDDDGREPRWVGVDPTNRCLAGDRYVKIGHGRSYRDVPPVKGVYRGSATATLEASVQMQRTDGAPARS